MRKLIAGCLANRLVSGIGYKVRRTTAGTSLEILPGAGGGKKAAGITYEGDYDNARAYSIGQVVRNRNGAWALGWFICVRDNPLIGIGLSVPPSFPEPETGAYWHNWTLGPKAIVSCKTGVEVTSYVNMIN